MSTHNDSYSVNTISGRIAHRIPRTVPSIRTLIDSNYAYNIDQIVPSISIHNVHITVLLLFKYFNLYDKTQ